MKIIVKDDSGINLMNGFQHNIRYQFNNEFIYYSANSNIFQYIDGCDSGYVSIYLPAEIETGTHIMHIEAWDNANNRSQEDIELIVRTNESIWKESYKDKQLTDEKIILAMIENPKLMERPIVINGMKAIIGRPPENVLEIIDQSGS